MSKLLSAIEKAETIAIGGHVRPDGDCIGSCMGLFRYIKKNYPDKQVCVYVEEIPDAFDYLKEEDAFYEKPSYDLFISLDCGDEERLGDAQKVMEKTPYVLNIDHHITNTKFGNENVGALYTGIVHDTGVFKHSNTTKETMEIAGKLIAFGIPFGKIIDDSFYRKTYKQLQIMGRCLMESVRIMDGRCLFSIVRQNVMKLYEAKPSDLDGIIDEMRTTEGVEVAILLDEREQGEFKVSMRSNEIVDVSVIARYFGGGGHVRAAGCAIKGSAFDVINNLTGHIEKQLG